ncbi:MAG: hypothetical protein AB7I59_12050 [Geminicoccaceae bacterium]
MTSPSQDQVASVGHVAAPAERPDLASRIERARRQLAPATEERAPCDSRWQNWYSR